MSQYKRVGGGKFDVYRKEKSNAGKVVGTIVVVIIALWALSKCVGS